ncbi:MAG: hypothetical protein M3Y57_20675 [Acidobacteriota bacterium]|nr:hypothetical protein [Acidobacteriota bacterium]
MLPDIALQNALETADVQSRRALVDRVASSELFQKAHRLREFLLYVADCTLSNRPTDVREQAIAERVFGRKPEFQTAEDSIVRAEARNLRKRLDTFFETEGKEEQVVILMPKGGYWLEFERRSPEIESSTLPPSLEAGIETRRLLPPNVLSRIHDPTLNAVLMTGRLRMLCVALSLVTVAAVGLAVYWHGNASRLQNRFRTGTPTLPFSALFNDDQDTFIITSDTGLLQISSLVHRRITLDEYMARTYPVVPQTELRDLIRNWNLYEFTDGREMATAGLIMSSNAQYAQHIALRSGHEVQLEDFKDHNTILIGSPVSNPWAQLYEDKLNFRCEMDEGGRISFRDRSALGNGIGLYPSANDIQHNRTYARLVFVPRISDAASTLLIAGTTAQSTQAAGELVVDRERMSQVLRLIGLNSSGPPHYFEILIRSNNFVGGAILPEVVAWRLKPAPER